MAACQVLPSSATKEAGLDARNLVWPKPPNEPRIRFLKATQELQGAAADSSMWSRFWGMIAGREEVRLVRPAGVAVNETKMAIADPGARAVWIVGRESGEFRKVDELGGRHLVSPVAVSPRANEGFYVADSYLAKVFLCDLQGKLTGAVNDPGFERPTGIVYDSKRQRLYVADSLAHKIWLFDGNGNALGAIGKRGIADGEFNFPTHVALDRDGNLYVVDGLNFRVQSFGVDGRFRSAFGVHGDTAGHFARPKGIALDSQGHIYVVEALFDAVQIFDREGRYLLTFGERGTEAGQFWLPGGIFIDARDQVYVADSYNERIQIFTYVADGK